MHDVAHELQKTILKSHILVVEDDVISRLFLERTLAQQGFTSVALAANGVEALASMQRRKPDMVILDIVMPEMDGFACCAAIRAQPEFIDLPVLIQTSLSEPEQRVKAFAHGATDFVSKPVYPQELVARVGVHLEKRHSMKSLQRYQNRIAMELEMARVLQQSILPAPEEIEQVEQNCQLEIVAHLQSSSELGGDFWGVKPLFPQQSALWLVDFSGHGVSSALNAFRLQAYLKEPSLQAARPGEYMAQMNDKLLRLLLRGQFATMFYGIVDSQSQQLFYACACAPHPLLWRHEQRDVVMLDGTGTPMGIGMHFYATQSVAFKAGDTLLLYSDALLETPNLRGELLSEETLIEILREYGDGPVRILLARLLAALREHAVEPPADDLTIIVCRRQPRSALAVGAYHVAD